MTRLEINIRENNGATKESAPYIGHAISKGSKNFIALTEEAAALCGLPAIQVEAILCGAFTESCVRTSPVIIGEWGTGT